MTGSRRAEVEQGPVNSLDGLSPKIWRLILGLNSYRFEYLPIIPSKVQIPNSFAIGWHWFKQCQVGGNGECFVKKF
jgi:hypothetical protein